MQSWTLTTLLRTMLHQTPSYWFSSYISYIDYYGTDKWLNDTYPQPFELRGPPPHPPLKSSPLDHETTGLCAECSKEQGIIPRPCPVVRSWT